MRAAAPLQNLAAKPQPLSSSTHAGLLLQRKCACGSSTPSLTGECVECKSTKRLQAKLAIRASNDPLEQEADRIADQVMGAPANPAVSGAPAHIQRFTGQATGQADTAPASVDRVLASPGRPLEPALQHDMEQRFGHDFSRVRVHSGGAAEQSAREVNANAYTVGRNIVFGEGQFAPGMHEGRRLIAHELTHVVQQSGADGIRVGQSNRKGGLPPISAISARDPGDRFEQEADRITEQVMRMAEPKLQRQALPARPLVHRHTADRSCGKDLPPIVNDVLSSPGQPLDAVTRAFFEPRFRANFGAVRVHTDARATDSARAVNALAYTRGTHVVFGAGEFASSGQASKRLLAHELAHVVQQSRGAGLSLQRKSTCNLIDYDPLTQCCCDERVIDSPCHAPRAGCSYKTSRDNEYDGCSAPDFLIDPRDKDNPGGLYSTPFSDPSIHGTKPQDFVPTLPCDVHDKCFQTCGSNRTRCNQRLFEEARAVCERVPLSGRFYERCKTAVDAAERLLPEGSKGPFSQRQREYCACCSPPDSQYVANVAIYFDTNKYELNTPAKAALERFFQINGPVFSGGDYQLELIGNASRLGDPTDNQILSENRIKAVRTGIKDLKVPLDNSRVHEVPLGEQDAISDVLPPDDNSALYRSVQINLRGRPPP